MSRRSDLCAACRDPATHYGLCSEHWSAQLKPLREHLEFNPNILTGAVIFIQRRAELLPAEWRPIVELPGCQVSSLGQVTKPNGELAPWDVNSSLYWMVTPIPGKRRLVHKLVAESFYGPCPKGHEVDHEDENTLNPSLKNLSYLTKGRNGKRRQRKPRRLTEEESAEIRRLAPDHSVHWIGAKLDISTQTVRKHARDVTVLKPGTVAKREACTEQAEEVDPFS